MSTFGDVAREVAALVASDVFSPATLTRASSGTFDPVTGSLLGGTTTSLPCRAVADTQYSCTSDGAIVSDTVLTLNVEPKKGDTLTMGALSFVLDDVSCEAPNGVALIYTAVARR